MHNSEKNQEIAQGLYGYALNALENLNTNYWLNQEGRFVCSDTNIFWEFTMAMLALETFSKLDSSNPLPDSMIKAQYGYWMNKFDEAYITYTGGWNNPAHDDAAWTSMAMMLCYTKTKDERALDLCMKMVQRAYDYWSDPKGIEHGMFYRLADEGNPEKIGVTGKSLYTVGLMYSALRCYEICRKNGSDKADALYEQTLKLYKWNEDHLRRDKVKEYEDGRVKVEHIDFLYFHDFIDDAEKNIYRPGFLDGPRALGASAIYGNMGMACIHKKLYDITGDEKYITLALETAQALAGYDFNGMFMNDRDAWTDGSFIGYFVSEIMTMDGVDKRLGKMFYKTACSIMNNCYFDGGYYGGEWNAARGWNSSNIYGNPIIIMTSATTAHMLIGAALCAKMGLIDTQDLEIIDFEANVNPKEMPEEMFEGAGRFFTEKPIK